MSIILHTASRSLSKSSSLPAFFLRHQVENLRSTRSDKSVASEQCSTYLAIKNVSNKTESESNIRPIYCNIFIYLYRNVPVNSELVKNVELYLGDVTCYDFSKLYCSIKVSRTLNRTRIQYKLYNNFFFNTLTSQGLESYLLILYRRLDIPQSYDLFERTYYAKKIIKYLHNMSFYFPFIKPFIYFLESYMRLLRGRKSTSQACMARAEKYAIAQGNKMVVAWIEQNKRVRVI